MRIAPTSESVRDRVVEVLMDLGVTSGDLLDLEETILIDAGKYFARSYKVAGLLAMWLIDVGIVQFYDAEGNMLRTINLFEELFPHRAAA